MFTRTPSQEVVGQYLALDPVIPPSRDEFDTMLVQIGRPATPAAMMVRANILLEKSTFSSTSINGRRDLVGQANDLFNAMSHSTGRPLIKSSTSQKLHAHIPLFMSNFLPESRPSVTRHIARMLEDSEDLVVNSRAGSTGMGDAFEHITTLVLAHSGINGITARPSFERQERNSILVDGKNYNWDITAQSNGGTIPSGEYRLQVKAGTDDFGKYHPDIVRVAGEKTFGIDRHDPCHIFEVGSQLCALTFGKPITHDIKRMQENLLNRLESTGPVIFD